MRSLNSYYTLTDDKRTQMDNFCSAIAPTCLRKLFVSNKARLCLNAGRLLQATNAILPASTICRMNIKQTESILFSYESTFGAVFLFRLTQRASSVSHVSLAPRNIATFTWTRYCHENRSSVGTNQTDIDTKVLFSFVRLFLLTALTHTVRCCLRI